MRLALVFAVALAANGCSSVSSNTGVAHVSPSPTPAISGTVSNGSIAPAPGLTPPPPGVAGPTPLPGTDTQPDGNANTFSRRPVKGTEQKGPPPPIPYRTGPDGSQIATYMNSDGLPVEARVFKGNLPFTRVEATWLDAKTKLVKFTLKKGKVVELRTDQLAALNTASAAQLVELSKQAK